MPHSTSSPSLSPSPLTTPFTSSSPISRSGAFFSLLHTIWGEKKGEVGSGEVRWEGVREVLEEIKEVEMKKESATALPSLLLHHLLPVLSSPDAHNKPLLLFLLSLLSEASNNPSFVSLLQPSLPLFFSLLRSAQSSNDTPLLRSLIYLLGHFEDTNNHKDTNSITNNKEQLSSNNSEMKKKDPILLEVKTILGENNPHFQTLVQLNEAGKEVEEKEDKEEAKGGKRGGTEGWRKKDFRESFLAFLGGGLWRDIGGGGDLLERAKRELACPVCVSSHSSTSPSSSLFFGEEEVVCSKCGEKYEFLHDFPVLIAPEEKSPQLYIKEVVDAYDQQKRDPFISMMSGLSHLPPTHEHNYLLSHFTPLPTGPILDLACGTGLSTALLSPLLCPPSRLLCMDYSPFMLRACRERMQGKGLFVVGSGGGGGAEVGGVPIQSGVLGGAICWDALQALPCPSFTVREVGRCLKKGAVFVCFTFRDARDTSWYKEKRGEGGEEGVKGRGGDDVYGYFQDKYPFWLRRRQFLVGELEEWVEEGGMEIIDVWTPGYALFFTARKK